MGIRTTAGHAFCRSAPAEWAIRRIRILRTWRAGTVDSRKQTHSWWWPL